MPAETRHAVFRAARPTCPAESPGHVVYHAAPAPTIRRTAPSFRGARMNIQTADLCDAHEDKLAVVAPMFASYGGRPSFGGPIATLKIFEDNSFVRKAAEGPGNGCVVIDGGASMRCALVGDQPPNSR